MGRIVSAGSVVYDQLDFFSPPNGPTRVPGVDPGMLFMRVFMNNVISNWLIQDGTLFPDSSISSGAIYFNEIPSASGFYSIRFFPDRIGFWRIVTQILSLNCEIIKEYDVVPAGSFGSSNQSSGLNASFIKP